MTSDFSAWLQDELDKRQMTPADLARLTRKDQGIFSRILGRKRQPNTDTLLAIAQALKLPPDLVFQAAGMLPPKPDTDPWVEEMTHKLSLLPPGLRNVAASMIEALSESEKSKPASKPKTKPAKS